MFFLEIFEKFWSCRLDIVSFECAFPRRNGFKSLFSASFCSVFFEYSKFLHLAFSSYKCYAFLLNVWIDRLKKGSSQLEDVGKTDFSYVFIRAANRFDISSQKYACQIHISTTNVAFKESCLNFSNL